MPHQHRSSRSSTTARTPAPDPRRHTASPTGRTAAQPPPTLRTPAAGAVDRTACDTAAPDNGAAGADGTKRRRDLARSDPGRWPDSALAAVSRAFDLLATPPGELRIDGKTIGHGLPTRPLALGELRQLLLDRGCPQPARDTAWRILLDNAHTRGPAWTVAAVGMALPALTRMAGRLSAGAPAGLVEDIEAELITGFLEALRHTDLSGPAPYARLCWAGWRRAAGVRRGRAAVELPELPEAGPHTPARPYGHPDLVLARAVAAGWITGEQAELISATRLGRDTIDQIATGRRVEPSVLRMRRRRGELALARALLAGDLDPARPTTRPTGSP